MMSPFPPNLAKCYRLVLGVLWLARMSTVCLSNLGLFMSKLLFGRMFIRIDACLSLAWFSLGLFWVGVGWHLGFLCLYASVSACVCLVAVLSRLVAGLFVPFPQSAFARLLGLCALAGRWAPCVLRLAVAWWFSLAFFPPGPSGFLLVVLAAVSIGPLFPVARMWWCGACPAPSSCAVR